MARHHQYDAIIVGAGGAGLMAALESSKQVKTAVLTKLYPTRSHTGAAQGGIGAALGNIEEDKWEWHMFDTIKGGDYLCDQDAVEVMCREAVDTVYALEHMGLPFSRTPEGKIDQRKFGGHTKDEGKSAVHRACYAADRTGHMILQTLYQQCIKQGIAFFDEMHVVDMVFHGGKLCGVVAYEMATGELHVFHTKAVLFATGGFGRMYKVTSNAHTLTGDGPAILLRHGYPLQDMEFFQIHPTGIRNMGILITEGVRGEGGILRNNDGEAFMERYTPTLKDLAPRDVVSRAMYREVEEGRGINGEDYLYLDATHLGRDVIEKKLPDIADFVRTYLGIDPVKEPIPVQPTAHYAMGGIPTNVHGQMVIDDRNTVLPGVYAAGECACVSVHGANRLGTNSLVDIIVFGRRGGRHMGQYAATATWVDVPQHADQPAVDEIQRLLSVSGSESMADIRAELQEGMTKYASVLREAHGLQVMLASIRALQQRFRQAPVQDKGTSFNNELEEAMELGYLLDLAWVTTHAALARNESRGAHYREDFQERDDAKFLVHSLAYLKDDAIDLTYKPVTITKYQPKPRVY